MSLVLSKLSETDTTITLGWTPPSGVTGYRFTAEKQAKPSHTWDPGRSSVKFSKGSAWYKVEAVGVSASGTYTGEPAPPPPPPEPTPTPTPTPTPPPPTGLVCVPYPHSVPLPAAWNFVRMPESKGRVVDVSTSAQLRSAISNAQAGDQIVLADGTYGSGELRYAFDKALPATNPATIRAKNPLKAKLTVQPKINVGGWRLEGIEIDGSSRSKESLGIEVKTGDVEINGCYVHDIYIGEIHAVGLFGYSGALRLLVLNTVFKSCGWGTVENPTSSHCMYMNGSKHVYANVVCDHTSGYGIQMYSKLFDSAMYHATLLNSEYGGFTNAGDSARNRVHNSIAWKNRHAGFRNQNNDPAFRYSHLIAFGSPSPWQNMTGSTLSTADPKLGTDRRPAAGSPAIGHVDPALVPAVDVLGMPRKGAGSAAGAYEPA